MLSHRVNMSPAEDQRFPMVVVEDEEPCRRALLNLLKHHGYAVIGYSSAEDAIKAFDATSIPSWMVVDVDLPGMCGLDLVRRLKASKPELHAIMLTAADRKMVQEFCDQNAVDYFPKPLDIARFLQHIARSQLTQKRTSQSA